MVSELGHQVIGDVVTVNLKKKKEGKETLGKKGEEAATMSMNSKKIGELGSIKKKNLEREGKELRHYQPSSEETRE